MSEYDEQVAVVEYCDLKDIAVIHIPNEGKRSEVEGSRLKRAGLRPGFPDLLIPMARGPYHSLFIEMKFDKGEVDEKQARWLWRLRDEGMAAWVCYGAKNAIACIDWYMGL